ncbi:sigma-70 family RNA polymerase sigma factor [Kineococcus radiotolerans]|uniref:RNA polymerase, sigma 28 subunit, FliA/WhiG family n=1 Tax=Kineococcus radiotolerans (strain ATCC BAA-149 / DSM 14245 / SRS30216) TaxID=266940 RepID=A6W8V7_KINRD|nr:sigma-70 family RNA polymerase sigma factor [Kineococcus radiotolerans]ABS03246.1 RNA polymerase, sigma 28 subunit, FliA/WhiG family [Kineococcus radiotolerans SRS30216 = ATCC BAA-149]
MSSDPAPTAEERFIADHGDIAMSITRRRLLDVAPSERDEAASAANLGLLQAARAWDPARGEVAPHLWHRINGAITDDFRARHGRPGSTRHKAMAAQVSLDMPLVTGGDRVSLTLGDTIQDPVNHIDRAMDRIDLTRAIDHLTDRDRRLLQWRFVDELHLLTIAGYLNVTESRVSQMEREVITRLRRFMNGDTEHRKCRYCGRPLTGKPRNARYCRLICGRQFRGSRS